MDAIAAPTVRILNGHVLHHLRELPDASVHCVVTSPPYWGLRDYSRCECAVATAVSTSKSVPGHSANQGCSGSALVREPDPACPKCHGTGKDESLEVNWPDGWHGQLGLESTPEIYVAHIVQVFQEVKRVLRDDGTLWLNMGDCYAANRTYQVSQTVSGAGGQIGDERYNAHGSQVPDGLKPKDLIGMPWRVAFALQADGWYLRSDIIWAKPNPMPESVTDRPTKAHEYVFLLSKSARYFYDADAVRENWSESTLERALHHYPTKEDNPEYGGKQTEDYKKYPIAGSLITPKGAQRELDRLRTPERMGHGPGWRERSDRIVGRNLRTVWTIPTQPYPEAHFATFPEALAERCIKAGTSEKGCCAACGVAWERVVEKTGGSTGKAWHDHQGDESVGQRIDDQAGTHGRGGHEPYRVRHLGFRPACDHGGDPVPCVVLDPFGGSGTTGAVARELGRSCILIEIKSQYNDLARARVRDDLKPLEAYA